MKHKWLAGFLAVPLILSAGCAGGPSPASSPASGSSSASVPGITDGSGISVSSTADTGTGSSLSGQTGDSGTSGRPADPSAPSKDSPTESSPPGNKGTTATRTRTTTSAKGTTTAKPQPTTTTKPDGDAPVFPYTDPADRSYFAGISPSNNINIPESEWQHFKELGVKSLRIELCLSDMSQAPHSPDKLNFAPYDEVVNRARQEEIEVVMILDYRTYPSDGRYNETIMDAIPYLDVMVPHFAALGVHSYEIWNEQNGTWKVEPERYMEFLTTVYEKFKYTDKWDPRATVCFGGIDAVANDIESGINTDAKSYFELCYFTDAYTKFKDKYGHSPFDAVALHPYGTVNVDRTGKITKNKIKEACTAFYNIMRGRGDKDIPIWLTELGDQNSNENYQAIVVEEYLKAVHELKFVTRLHYFKYLYVGKDYSLVTDGRVPKPSFQVYKDVVKSFS